MQLSNDGTNYKSDRKNAIKNINKSVSILRNIKILNINQDES